MKRKPTRRRRPKRRSTAEEMAYVCDSCGEEIVVSVDVSAGSHQEYVEDCPVCCHPMRLRVCIDHDGAPRIDCEHE